MSNPSYGLPGHTLKAAGVLFCLALACLCTGCKTLTDALPADSTVTVETPSGTIEASEGGITVLPPLGPTVEK